MATKTSYMDSVKLERDLRADYENKGLAAPEWLNEYVQNMSAQQFVADCFFLRNSPLEYVVNPAFRIDNTTQALVSQVITSMQNHVRNIHPMISNSTGEALDLRDDVNKLIELLGLTEHFR